MSSQVCLWNDCLKDCHHELYTHLSNDHIGWKRNEYQCLWNNCHRQAIKWYSRFSFINHLRIHTRESPYECRYCFKTFSIMEGLDKHVKTEHEPQVERKVPASIKRKRKIAELQSRQHSDQLSEDSDDLQDLPLLLEEQRDNIPKLKSTSNSKGVKKESSIKDQYKLAKAQLNYILRENEMLCDEWTATEKKLKRLRTERRVLLDALVKRGYNHEDE